MTILLENIQRRYPRSRRPSLDIKGLTILGGRVHGILGHSGSGKSTLLNVLGLLDEPDRSVDTKMAFYPDGAEHTASCWVPDSKRGGHEDDDWRRKHCAFVFQSHFLLDNFSVIENVLMPIRLKGAVHSDTRVAAKELLDGLGIAERQWKKLPHQLSGGERQRVAVARALAHNPKLIFADEPTGSLDPDWGEKVMEKLCSWQKNGADSHLRLLLLVTHNVDHVMAYCQSVTVLRAGQIVLNGEVVDHTEAEIRRAMSQHEPSQV